MVVLKGGGSTYQITSGKTMPWEDVPDGFKKALDQQQEIKKCVDMRERAQRCIEENGFFDATCVQLTDAFHLCQANELRAQLPIRKPSAAE